MPVRPAPTLGYVEADAPAEVADRLLDAMAAIRRTVRRLSGRPPLLSALPSSQLELVRLVRRRPGISVADAAQELHLAANSVSTLVGQLTDAGVVTRLADPSDRRVAKLDLEAKTRRSMTGWHDRRTEAIAAAIERLSARDRRRLVDALPVLAQLAGTVAEESGAAEAFAGDADDRRTAEDDVTAADVPTVDPA